MNQPRPRITRERALEKRNHDIAARWVVKDKLNGVDVLPGFACKVAELFENG